MNIQKLPRSGNAYVEELKIKEYLLNLEHEQGKSKAIFFTNRGFTIDNWRLLENSLVLQGQQNDVIKTTDTPYGKKFTVECTCPTPDETNPCIRTVWEIKNEEEKPRLITAHPL